MPEGVIIAERYYNQAHAVVLVYTVDDGPCPTYVAVCLGCHFTAKRDKPNHRLYCLADAGKAANEHATSCRALPRDIPSRPDDDTVRERLRSWADGARVAARDIELWLFDLDLIRLDLQRTNGWIEAALQQLAVDHPEILRVERSTYSGRIPYYARRRPQG